MLKVSNLSKSYEVGVKAVNNLNLQIMAGEIFAFIGHNGAGKTTAIKSIVGILEYEEGEITLDGLSLKNNPTEYKNLIAYIPDNPELYNNLTGIQFLDFIAGVYNIDPIQKRDAIIKYAKVFEMSDRLGDLVGSYSHGMKQKLLLISAIIRKPKLLILDEPFVGLDPNASFKMKEIMKEMAKEGSIIMFSTHILEVAEKLCDHVGIIKKGVLMKYGTMAEIVSDQSLESVFMEMVDNE